MDKSKTLAQISTAVTGIYLLILIIIDIKTAFLCRDFSQIGVIGMDLATRTRNLDDYICGYAMIPGAFFTLLGSSFGGVIFFLLMGGMTFVCIILLMHIVVSCIFIKKEKLRADAILKLVLLAMGLLFSAILLKSVVLSILIAVPLLMAVAEYSYAKKETDRKMRVSKTQISKSMLRKRIFWK